MGKCWGQNDGCFFLNDVGRVEELVGGEVVQTIHSGQPVVVLVKSGDHVHVGMQHVRVTNSCAQWLRNNPRQRCYAAIYFMDASVACPMEQELNVRMMMPDTADQEAHVSLHYRRLTQQYAYGLLRDVPIPVHEKYDMSVLLEAYALRVALAPQFFDAPRISWVGMRQLVDKVIWFVKCRQLVTKTTSDKLVINDEDWEKWLKEM